jgi:hypothetical protein
MTTPKGKRSKEKVVSARQTDGRTLCCKAFTTFVDDMECCKVCYAPAGNQQVGSVLFTTR